MTEDRTHQSFPRSRKTDQPLYLKASGEYITDADRQLAMKFSIDLLLPVVISATPKPTRRSWWKFWNPKGKS
ncbi:hypothetical protein CFAEC_06090 [Corynebacterium faecale]|uniref:hypothetical protein n=1 Tax=Corynebacterium faecale TaxID=1758466 RepID=UPI0025B45A5E|nr:hypothetical protein [Corynebacterium faecale]WJY92054.1 hypothetical protein CFAEC_06090 [Corynebacterium faecale]